MACLCVLLILAGGLGARVGGARLAPFFRNFSVWMAAGVAGAAALLFFARHRGLLSKDFLWIGLLALMAVDLMVMVRLPFRLAERGRFFPRTESVDFLRRMPGRHRVVAFQDHEGPWTWFSSVFPPNTAMMEDLEDMRGWSNFMLRRHAQLFSGVENSNLASLDRLYRNRIDLYRNNAWFRWLDLFNVKYVLLSNDEEDLLRPPKFRLVHSGEIRIYENMNVLPRAFVVHRYEVEKDPARAIRRLSEATIDGKEAPVTPANFIFQGVPVPEGEHMVVFRFRPESFMRGMAVSGGTAVFLLIAAKNLLASEYRRNILRQFNTWGFRQVLHILFDYPYHDTHGIKIWRASAVREILPEVHFDRDLFDTEMILRGVRAGWRVREVPIVVEEKRSPRLSILPRIARTLKDLIMLRRLMKPWVRPGQSRAAARGEAPRPAGVFRARRFRHAEQVQIGLQETRHGVLRGVDDGLAFHIERGVQEDRHARLRAEGLQQLPVKRVGIPRDRLNAPRSVRVRTAGMRFRAPSRTR